MQVQKNNCVYEIELDNGICYWYEVAKVEQFSEILGISDEEVVRLMAIVQKSQEDLILEDSDLKKKKKNWSFEVEEALEPYIPLILNRTVSMEIALDRLVGEPVKSVSTGNALESIFVD